MVARIRKLVFELSHVMQLLLAILRAAHCRSTHHYFAIDALPLVQTSSGQRLANLLLRHHDRYLAGAKDPDNRFRDFQNHVIHVADGYWGGAPRVAHQWYDRMIRYLRTDRWGDAAHAAGVLSHYFTDPMQPLHTAQCEREKVLHRPMEWSITKSYHRIVQIWREDEMRVVFQLSDSPGWLGEAILHGARFAHRKYEFLLDHYRLAEGVADPPSGLDYEACDVLAELFGLAITGWARVLERAAMDAEAVRASEIPTHLLALTTLFSTIQVPQRIWLRRVESKIQQTKIQKLFDEYQRTGDLRENLPSDIQIVHRVVKIHREEKTWKARRQQQRESTRTKIEIHSEGSLPVPVSEPKDSTVSVPFIVPEKRDRKVSEGIQSSSQTLSRRDPLVEAPSIGPKTAARFAEIGITRVGDFLEVPADQLAKKLQTYWLSSATIRQWQMQTQLMCEIPNLRARDAQLLAGTGCKSAADLARSDVSVLHQDILRYSVSSEGRRYLRGAKPPSRAEVAKWVRSLAAGPTKVDSEEIRSSRAA